MAKLVKHIVWTLLTKMSEHENKGVEEIVKEMKTEFTLDLHSNHNFKCFNLNGSNEPSIRRAVRKYNRQIMNEKCLKRMHPSLPNGAIRIGH